MRPLRRRPPPWTDCTPRRSLVLIGDARGKKRANHPPVGLVTPEEEADRRSRTWDRWHGRDSGQASPSGSRALRPERRTTRRNSSSWLATPISGPHTAQRETIPGRGAASLDARWRHRIARSLQPAPVVAEHWLLRPGPVPALPVNPLQAVIPPIAHRVPNRRAPRPAPRNRRPWSRPIGITGVQDAVRGHPGARYLLAATNVLQPRAAGRPGSDPLQGTAQELLHGLVFLRRPRREPVAHVLGNAAYGDPYRHERTLPSGAMYGKFGQGGFRTPSKGVGRRNDNGRHVMASAKPDNPYHADIVLPDLVADKRSGSAGRATPISGPHTRPDASASRQAAARAGHGPPGTTHPPAISDIARHPPFRARGTTRQPRQRLPTTARPPPRSPLAPERHAPIPSRRANEYPLPVTDTPCRCGKSAVPRRR